MLTPKESVLREFPRRLMTLAALATLALAVTAGIWVMQHGFDDRESFSRLQRAQYLAQELTRCDEGLRLTAHLAAWTGGEAWAQQYQRIEARAAELLTEAAQGVPELFQEIPARHLTRVERQILEQARQGNLSEAQRLLTGEEYSGLKQFYFVAWRRVHSALSHRAEFLLSQHQQRTLEAGGILLLAGLAQAILWVLVIRYVRTYLAQRAEREAALQESEELNRTLLASLPQRVFYKDRNLVIRGVNAALAADLGKSADEVVGRTDADFYPPELAAKYQADDRRVMGERQPITTEEHLVAGGQERFVEVVKAPVVNQGGAVIGLVGLYTDITARKQSQTKLRDYARRLAQNNRELQEFAFVASHDLQEPLRKVRTFGDRLKAKCGAGFTPEGQDYLARMQNAAERMQLLIEALLAYSRITTLAKPFEEVELGKIAAEVVSDLEIRVEQTGAVINVGELPVLKADPTQIRQLFQNLLSNALKFHQPGQRPEISITATVFPAAEAAAHNVPPAVVAEHPPQAPFCQLQVRDNGIGFDEKYTERIFGVFQRLHGRGEYEGAGVGLAICRKIVQRHQGDIAVRSQPGEGTAFFITLPMAPVTAHETALFHH